MHGGTFEALKKAEKDGEMSEDELHDLEDQAQQVTDEAVKKVDEIVADKEKEILEG